MLQCRLQAKILQFSGPQSRLLGSGWLEQVPQTQMDCCKLFGNHSAAWRLSSR